MKKRLPKALKQGIIKGAALDVYQQEPLQSESPLLNIPNIVTVPHIGSAVQKTRDAMARLAAENLLRGLRGEIPPNIVAELRFK
jgi:gluconate 2-dehydrogenase